MKTWPNRSRLRLMKTLSTVICFLAISLRCLAQTNALDPSDVLKREGVLMLSDGSTFYIFKTNGIFTSLPANFSGPALDGTYVLSSMTTNLSRFTAQARTSWVNSIQTPAEYRRIVIAVYPGHMRPAFQKGEYRLLGRPLPTNKVFECRFVVEENTKIPRPEK